MHIMCLTKCLREIVLLECNGKGLLFTEIESLLFKGMLVDISGLKPNKTIQGSESLEGKQSVNFGMRDSMKAYRFRCRNSIRQPSSLIVKALFI